MKNTASFKTVLFQAILIIAPLTGISSHNTGNAEELKEAPEAPNKNAFNTAIPEKDAKFIAAAAQINVEEIRLSELAQQKSITVDIRELAGMMIVAHRKWGEELTKLVEKKMIIVSALSTDNAQNTYNKLRSISGMDFDKEYCKVIVDDHQQAIAIFKKAAKECTDADVKEWARATLPELQKHLDYAIKCQNKIEKFEMTQE